MITNKLNGHCLCKAISFTIPVPSRFDVCHCVDCRRWHGASAIGIDSTEVTLIGDAPTLTWFSSSPMAERGFCSTCGTSLFYRLKRNRSRWSAYVGSLVETPKGIPLGYQCFLNQKPDFYAVVSQD